MEANMEVIHDRVAGLDVHKDAVIACARTMSGTAGAARHTASFQ